MNAHLTATDWAKSVACWLTATAQFFFFVANIRTATESGKKGHRREKATVPQFFANTQVTRYVEGTKRAKLVLLREYRTNC